MSNIPKIPGILNYRIQIILMGNTPLHCLLNFHLHSEECAFPHPNHQQNNLILHFADWSANIIFGGKNLEGLTWDLSIQSVLGISFGKDTWAWLELVGLRLAPCLWGWVCPMVWLNIIGMEVGHGIYLRKLCWCDFKERLKEMVLFCLKNKSCGAIRFLFPSSTLSVTSSIA